MWITTQRVGLEKVFKQMLLAKDRQHYFKGCHLPLKTGISINHYALVILTLVFWEGDLISPFKRWESEAQSGYGKVVYST